MKNKPQVILEFNGTTIRVCRSRTAESGRVITHCFSFDCPASEDETVRTIIRQMRQRRLRPESVILSLPRYIATAQLLRLPSRDPKEIRAMVALRVLREIGSERAKGLIYDHQSVGTDKDGHAIVSVFLVHKDRLMNYVHTLEKAGFLPHQITLNTQGLLQGLAVSTRAAFLLNVDQNTFDFSVVVGGCPVFSRTFNFSRQISGSGACDILKEIKVSFELCRRMAGIPVSLEDKFYVTGLLKKWELDALQECVPLPVEKIDLMEDPRIVPTLRDSLKDASVSFASVLGLALKEREDGINLMPPEFEALRKARRKQKHWQAARRLAIATLLVFSLLLVRGVSQRMDVYEKKAGELRALLPQEEALKHLKKVQFIEKNILKDRFVLESWTALYPLTPAGVFLTSLDINENRQARLEGLCADPAALFQYLEVLEGSPHFKKCEITFQENKQGVQNEKIVFRISCAAEGL